MGLEDERGTFPVQEKEEMDLEKEMLLPSQTVPHRHHHHFLLLGRN
jgi:hypothetical protein